VNEYLPKKKKEKKGRFNSNDDKPLFLLPTLLFRSMRDRNGVSAEQELFEILKYDAEILLLQERKIPCGFASNIKIELIAMLQACTTTLISSFYCLRHE